MIRYSNRFKAGTRRNKRYAKAKGPDRHEGILKDFRSASGNGLVRAGVDRKLIRQYYGDIIDTSYEVKPNHAARVFNLDWKAIKENERRAKEDLEANTSSLEGAKEYMGKVLERK